MVSKTVIRRTNKHQGFMWPMLVFVVFVISIASLFWHYQQITFDQMMVKDLAQLSKIFENIHRESMITQFEHVKNHIDFLNVKSFSGSRVGSMNLAFAHKWQGPYLQNNLTMQEKFYVILKNKQGYFIVPGDGVRLDNGKVIGKDIILDEHTDMHSMMLKSDGLQSTSGPLAVKINIGSTIVGVMMQTPELIQSID